MLWCSSLAMLPLMLWRGRKLWQHRGCDGALLALLHLRPSPTARETRVGTTPSATPTGRHGRHPYRLWTPAEEGRDMTLTYVKETAGGSNLNDDTLDTRMCHRSPPCLWYRMVRRQAVAASLSMRRTSRASEDVGVTRICTLD